MTSTAAERHLLRSSPYWPVISHRQLRRVLPGLAISAIGDAMSTVAMAWLALQLAPAGQRGTWIAAVFAAYLLPAAAGAILFRRFLRGRAGAQLAGWNATLHAAALATIVIAYALGGLNLGLYVTLLAASSLLTSWGAAGRYTMIAELLPERHHLAANAVITGLTEFAAIVGPPLAGLLISLSSPVVVIAVDGASFAILAATYRLAVPAKTVTASDGDASRAAGFRIIWRNPTLLALMALTFGFFVLFGPVYVALPLHVADDLHASATVLGVYWTSFGTGAVLGALVTGYLRRWRLWPTTLGIVVGFGVVMLPFGLGAPIGVTLTSFALAGLIWAPYMSTTMALFQRTASTAHLPEVLAANGAVIVLSVPLGTMLAGPLIAATGAEHVLLGCAIGTILLGTTAAGILVTRRRSHAATTSPAQAPGNQPDGSC
jgi:MFS transporter, DHA3 family, macrolide efflux protein